MNTIQKIKRSPIIERDRRESKKPDVDQIALQFAWATSMIRGLLAEELPGRVKGKPAGSSRAIELLGHLYRYEGDVGLSHSDLCRLSHSEAMTVSQAIQGLKRRRCATGRRDPDDKRIVRLRITEKGRAVYAPIDRLQERIINELRAEWGNARVARFLKTIAQCHLLTMRQE